jgi:hypothetical protein
MNEGANTTTPRRMRATPTHLAEGVAAAEQPWEMLAVLVLRVRLVAELALDAVIHQVAPQLRRVLVLGRRGAHGRLHLERFAGKLKLYRRRPVAGSGTRRTSSHGKEGVVFLFLRRLLLLAARPFLCWRKRRVFSMAKVTLSIQSTNETGDVQGPVMMLVANAKPRGNGSCTLP